MEKRKLRVFLLVGIFFILVWASINTSWCAEKKYPTRPIELSCGFGPGGQTDLMNRAVANILQKHLGVRVDPVVRAGGGGIVSISALINSPPDGYSLATTGMNIFPPLILGHATYKLEDFRIIGQFAVTACMMAVRADAPWKTFQEFLDYEKKNPGVKYAHPGVGAVIYMRMQNLIRSAHLKMVGVPFKAEVETIPAVLGGHVPIGIFSSYGARSQVQAGKMRILFSFEPTASVGLDPSIADINTAFGKSVVDRDVEVLRIMIAPKKTPDDIIQVLEQALEKGCKDPEFASDLKKIDMPVTYVDGKTFTHQKVPTIMSNFKAIISQ
jgi:tripartite-type tricarboxylate transporter receptor subunit TctC